MFEEEAEEYKKDLKSKFFLSEPQLDLACQGFKDGLRKANEWHFVKDELPPKNIPLNILTLDKDKKKRLWTGEYKGGNGEWWTGYFNHFIDKPYAWKEIVLPEGE